MNQPSVVAAPYTYISKNVTNVMSWVMIALTPATLYGFWLYGWPAIFLWCLTILSTLAGEAFCLRLMGKPAKPVLLDCSAALTGWLLAVSLPPWAPWWIGVMGGLFAAIFGKQVFGGLGQNPFNPAMVARVALLISFPVPMTSWVSPLPITTADAPGLWQGLMITLNGMPKAYDAIASASLLGFAKTEMSRGLDLVQAFAQSAAPSLSIEGFRQGSLGETASFLVAGGGLVLLWLRIITWHIPAAVLAGVMIPAAIAHGIDPGHYLPASSHLISGGIVLGAFFIATDYVTSPNTPLGQILFGLGIGFLTWIIRTWGGYPEGVAFAVMLMNIMTPIIDRVCKPRIYGRNRRGKPIVADKVI
ncbi:MAG: RnfABCDGE type electron transport complex subunit D [Rhodocyclaceae bacterium]|nr:MAG: RnfABCDGE type electron transport complex subunit D [Rhodocyclaceae bacterium]